MTASMKAFALVLLIGACSAAWTGTEKWWAKGAACDNQTALWKSPAISGYCFAPEVKATKKDCPTVAQWRAAQNLPSSDADERLYTHVKGKCFLLGTLRRDGKCPKHFYAGKNWPGNATLEVCGPEEIDMYTDNGTCYKGWHRVNNVCRYNYEYCNKADYKTGNCTSCKWYAFRVDNAPVVKDGETTGGVFCETRWWFWVYMATIVIVLLNALVACCMACCCPPKKQKRVHEEYVVEAEEAAPEREVELVQDRVTVERGDARVWRDQPVVREHRGDVVYGDRVLVETRYMSPGRDARVERHDHTDWAKYSQAHWHEH